MSTAHQRTAKARQALADKFSTPDEKSAYYADLAQRSNAQRLTLNKTEREALASAYKLLGDIARRHGLDELTTA